MQKLQKKLNKNLKSFILLLIIFITVSSCQSIVYIEPVPESFPGLPDKAIFEKIDFSEIPESEIKKFIINEYRVFIQDATTRIRYQTILLINGNITPIEFDESVRPLYEDLSEYTKAFEDFKEKIGYKEKE